MTVDLKQLKKKKVISQEQSQEAIIFSWVTVFPTEVLI
jgi:hypothetical protein